MPGYDDPRYVQQKFEAMQKDVELLKKSALPFAIHQRGAVPGAMRAIQIGDVGLKGNMWLSQTGNQPGQAPYQAVTDLAGVTRVEFGNLAANGISPAQYGFRTNDASQVPLFDSLGVIGVMSSLGSNFFPGNQTITSATPVLITQTAVTFTLTRAIRVLIVYSASVSENPTGSGNLSLADLFIDGSNQSAGGNGPAIELQYAPTTNGAVTSTGVYTPSLASGSHTVDLRGSTNGTAGINVTQAAMLCYRSGG